MFKKNIGKRLFIQSSSNLFFQIFTVLLRLAYVPFIISYIGISNYGLVVTIISFSSYISLIDIGLRNYIINRCTKFYYQNKLSLTISIFSKTIKLILLLVISSIIIIILFYLNINYLDDFINIEKNILAPCLLLCISNLIALLISFFSGYFRVIGKLIFSLFYETLTIIFPIISFIIIFFFVIGENKEISSLYYFSVIIFSFTLILLIIISIIFNRALPFKIIFKKKLDIKKYFKYVKKSIFFMIWWINSLIVANVIIQFTAIYIGSTDVAEISVMRMITNLVVVFIGAICHPILPDITRFSSDSDDSFFKKIIRSYYFLLFISTILPIICLYFVGEKFLNMWINDLVFDTEIFIILLIMTSFTCYNVQNSNILLVINKHEKYAICNLFNSVFYILVSYLLIKNKGLIGLLYAFVIYEIINTLIAQIFLNIYFDNLRKILVSFLFINLFFIFLLYYIPQLIILFLLLILLILFLNFNNIKNSLINF